MKAGLLALTCAAGVTLAAQNPVPAPAPRQGSPEIYQPPLVTIADLLHDQIVEDMIDAYDEWYDQQRRPKPVPREQVQEDTQDQHSVLDDIAGDEKLVISSNRPAPREPDVWRLFSSPFAVVSAEQPAAGGLQFLFTSLGVSTGEAFDVRIVNHTGKPVTLGPGGLVLRPLKKNAAEQLTREFNQQAAKAVKVRLSGYCLQFRKDPPKAGMVYVAAPAETQEQYAAAPIIFRSASLMKKKGLLKPTGNPTSYFHSIRQWAWWTQEQRFTEETFTTALLDYTKKNMQNAKQPWSKEAEAYVRASAPNRWADIANTLRLAQKIAAKHMRR
jgi:hypothetical protein